jgi:hypothetical protein
MNKKIAALLGSVALMSGVANIDLTETEAPQFWLVYDRYTAELATIGEVPSTLSQSAMRQIGGIVFSARLEARLDHGLALGVANSPHRAVAAA